MNKIIPVLGMFALLTGGSKSRFLCGHHHGDTWEREGIRAIYTEDGGRVAKVFVRAIH